MARSLVKAMLAAKVTGMQTSRKTYMDLRRSTWKSSDGVERFNLTGFVVTPNNLTVIVWSGGPVNDPMGGTTSCSIFHNGRKYHASVRWSSQSEITLRRVAVAFAKKAKGRC